MLVFAPLFSNPVFKQVQVLLLGALLTPGKRTVTAALRIMGLSQEKNYHKYHRVLSRARWSPRKAARCLLLQLLSRFAPDPEAPLVFGLDDTIERRRGKKIKAKGIYRDPVRSSKSHFVKTSGLRWLSMMLLVKISWAQHVWALPFLTVLAPSERYHEEQGQHHKTLTDYARQMILQVRRWLPRHKLIFVGDNSFSALAFLASVAEVATFITLAP